MARLGDVCLIQAGGTPSRSNGTYWEGGTIPWVKISDFDGKHLSSVSEYITEQGLDNSSAKIFCPGTILYTIFATLGETCILDMEATTNQAIAGLQIIDDRLTTEYLYYFLVAQKDYVNEIGRGVAQNNINLGILRNMQIDIPSIAIQHQVAQSLDKVDTLISLRKQQIAKLDELVKARFVEMFGDPEVNLRGFEIKSIGELVSVEPQNGMYKPQSSYVQDGTGTPILRIDAFYNGKVTDFHSLKRLTCAKAEIEKYLLHEHDIVINRVNSLEYLGKCAHIVGMYEPTVFESNMMRLHLDDTRADPCFITHLLCSDYVRKQIMNRAKKAVNQASINQNDVQSLLVLVPPVVLQHQFAAFVAQTDQQKLTIQHSLAKLETLKKSLMQKFFG